MSDDFARDILRRNIAQICQTIGWNAINSTPLDVLVHVLEKYMLTLGTQAHRYAEQFNRTEPNLHDLGLVFKDLNIRLPELKEYARCVPPVASSLNVSSFPIPRESHLNFLKPGSHEVLTRLVHIHEHLPPMYPEKEKETSPPVGDTIEITQNGHITVEHVSVNCKSPDPSSSEGTEKTRDVFKRPIDPGPLTPSSFKKPRIRLDEEDCHTREISSVMMTMSGFLSPAREGKLPEARVPGALTTENHSSPIASRSHLPLHKLDKKMKRLKSVNGKIDKGKKKDRSRKKVHMESKIDKVALHLARSKERTMNSSRKVPAVPLNNQVPSLAERVLPPVNDVPHQSVSVHNSMDRPSVIKTELASTVELQPQNNTSLHVEDLQGPKPSLSTVKIDDDIVPHEKLTSQPDRSKLNIFKKISTKVKDEKPPNENCFVDKVSHHEMNSHRMERINQPVANFKMSDTEHVRKQKTHHVRKEYNMENAPYELVHAVDLSARKSQLVEKDLINLPDKLPNNNRQNVRKERMEELPRDLSKPKLHMPPSEQLPIQQTIKIKKERKRRERKEKPDKATRDYEKMLKRQELAQTKINFNYAQEYNKRDGKKDPKIHSGFPFFPLASGLMPGRGLIPGTGLIPGPGLIPNTSLFSGLANNPALRGMLQPDTSGLVPNPFSFPGGFLPGGPGLMGGLTNPLVSLSSSFGQPPRIPPQPHLPHLPLRRPSLEVIPIEDDTEIPRKSNQPMPSVSRHPVLKHKNEKHKNQPSENAMHNHVKPLKISPPKQSLHNSNPQINVSPVRPDVTIEVSPRIEKPQQPIVPPPTPPPPPPVVPPPLPVPLVVPEEPIHLPVEESVVKEKVKLEKKKDKSHKKEKKEKDIKIKKKKDKRDKSKEGKKRDKDIKLDLKEKIRKEKKDKHKDKVKAPGAPEGIVPKLTLKLGSNSPLPPNSPDLPRKLNIKPIVKKEEPVIAAPVKVNDDRISPERSHSPELARISALVTRPPKMKTVSKLLTPVVHKAESSEIAKPATPPPQTSSAILPGRKNKPPSHFSKYKRILFKPIPKRSGSGFDDSSMDLESDGISSVQQNAIDKVPNLPTGTAYYTDEHGNKVWICPACSKPDNGTPMIGCDGCDCWYHWVCVGIDSDPGDAVDWYCKSCVAKKAATMAAMSTPTQMAKKRGRKPKMRDSTL